MYLAPVRPLSYSFRVGVCTLSVSSEKIYPIDPKVWHTQFEMRLRREWPRIRPDEHTYDSFTIYRFVNMFSVEVAKKGLTWNS